MQQRVKWTIRTPGRRKYEASPLAADGKIYLVNFDGEVTVVKTADGKIINTITMKASDEYPIRSSPVAAQGHLFVRTNRKLFCVGKSKADRRGGCVTGSGLALAHYRRVDHGQPFLPQVDPFRE